MCVEHDGIDENCKACNVPAVVVVVVVVRTGIMAC